MNISGSCETRSWPCEPLGSAHDLYRKGRYGKLGFHLFTEKRKVRKTRFPFFYCYYIMYSVADIDSLSVGQLRKLLKGGAVRVRCGSGMKVNLSAPQHKKLASAHKKGKMMTLTMDPYQAEMHGQGLFGDIGSFFRSVPASAERIVTRQLPSALIHQGLPEAGAYLGGVAGAELGGPVGSVVGSKLGRMGGKKLAEETGRRTGYGMKGKGVRIEDQPFTLREVADTGKKMFGRGTRIEDQPFTLRDVADTGKKMFGGRAKKAPMSGEGLMEDMLKSAKSKVKTMARKAASHVLHKVLPKATEQMGEMAGEYAGVRGGKEVGRMLGDILEQQVAAQTGLGMKMKKRGRPKKGGALMVAGVR